MGRTDNFFGSIGTRVSTVLGGYLLDIWTQGGPFLMMGMGSTAILLFALFVRLRHGAASGSQQTLQQRPG